METSRRSFFFFLKKKDQYFVLSFVTEYVERCMCILPSPLASHLRSSGGVQKRCELDKACNHLCHCEMVIAHTKVVQLVFATKS